VQQLCNFLNRLGARIEGIGSNVLTIQGVERLRSGAHRIAADYLEVGSFIALAAVTRGELLIQDAAPEYMRMILTSSSGWHRGGSPEAEHLRTSEQPLKIKPDLYTSLVKIDDGPWPAFPRT